MKKMFFFSCIITSLILASCGGKVVETMEDVADSTVDAVGGAADAVVDTAGDVVDGAVDLGEASADAFAGAADAVVDTAGDVVDGAADMADKVADTASDAVDAMQGKDDSDSQASAGVYAPYTDSALSGASGKVVLAFHANWCPSCVSADKNLKENGSDIPADVTILEVNYDDAQDLREKYNVTSQHTYVQVDSAGELLKKWKGGSTVSEIVGQIQ